MFFGRPWSAYYHLLLYLLVFVPIFYLFNFVHCLANFLFPQLRKNNNHLIDVRRILWIPRTRVLLPEMRVLHVHARYEDAREFSWRDPNVHLFGVTKEGATFVRTKGGLQIFNSSIRSFMNDSINDFAIEFGVVPLQTFKRIAVEETQNSLSAKSEMEPTAEQLKSTEEWTELRQPSSKLSTKRNKPTVVIIGIQSRSGSTLLCQHFEDLNEALVLNQPKAVLDVALDAFMSHGSLIGFLPTTLIYLSKFLWTVEGISVVVLKLGTRSTLLLSDLLDLQPQLPFQTKFLLSYRHPIDSFKSYTRLTTQIASDAFGLAGQLPLLRWWFPDPVYESGRTFAPIMIRAMKRFVGNEAEWKQRFSWMDNLDLNTKDMELLTLANCSSKDGETLVSLGWTSMTSHFVCFTLMQMLVLRELQRRPSNQVLPVSYEEMTRNPSMWTSKILPFCGLRAPKVFNAMARDSQANSSIGNDWMKKQHRTSLSKSHWDKLDGIVKKSGIAKSIYDDIRDYDVK